MMGGAESSGQTVAGVLLRFRLAGEAHQCEVGCDEDAFGRRVAFPTAVGVLQFEQAFHCVGLPVELTELLEAAEVAGSFEATAGKTAIALRAATAVR